MEYLSVKETARRWNIDSSRVSRLAREGRIDGAIIIARNWLIPANAEKPADQRTKGAKRGQEGELSRNSFRFPLYINGDEASFTPPLTAEEKLLRSAQLDFLSCDFAAAEEKLQTLQASGESVSVRLMSLFLLCWLSAVNNSSNKFDAYFLQLELALSEDFPHQKDMELLKPWLYAALAQYKNASENYHFDDKYDYSPSTYPLLTCLSFLNEECFNDFDAASKRFDLYKMIARQLENSKAIFEAMLLYEELFIFYFIEGNEEMNYCLKKAVEIAYRHNFVYPIADMYPYYGAVIDNALMSYPCEFCEKVKECAQEIALSFSEFSKKNKEGSIFSTLSNSDIKYVLFSLRGYSYKQVAEALHVSERTVANRYSLIYDKLSVSSRKEFLATIKNIL